VGYPAPEQERPGHDLTYLAETGLLDPPRLPRTLLADIAGGERTASIATALLLGAARGQVASHVQVSLKDAAQALAEPLVYGATKAGNALTGGFAGYNLYAAAQGWVAVAALEESLWAQLTSALGIPETSGIDMLAEVFSSRPAGEWEAWARAHNLPVAAVKQADDMPGQP